MAPKIIVFGPKPVVEQPETKVFPGFTLLVDPSQVMSTRVSVALARVPTFLMGKVNFVMLVGQVGSAAAVGVLMMRNSAKLKLTVGNVSPMESAKLKTAVTGDVGVSKLKVRLFAPNVISTVCGADGELTPAKVTVTAV